MVKNKVQQKNYSMYKKQQTAGKKTNFWIKI